MSTGNRFFTGILHVADKLKYSDICALNCSVDATEEPVVGPKLGRLVNHGDRKSDRNAKVEILDNNGLPVLCIFATKAISAGNQILMDYGIPVPWLKKVGLHY